MNETNTARNAAVTSLLNASLHSAQMARDNLGEGAYETVLNGCLHSLSEIGVAKEEIIQAWTFIQAEMVWLKTTDQTQKMVMIEVDD